MYVAVFLLIAYFIFFTGLRNQSGCQQKLAQDFVENKLATSEAEITSKSRFDSKMEEIMRESYSDECKNHTCYCPGPQREGRSPICIYKATPRESTFKTNASRFKFFGWGDDDRLIFEKFFQNPIKLDGVYLEMGALDGETGSNSLFFDEVLGWNGVLIESSPTLFRQVRRRRPHAIKIQMAACADPLGQIEFLGGGGSTDGVLSIMPPAFRDAFHAPHTPRYNVSCAPLGVMLRHAGVTHVDLFSLDVENAELETLLTIDFGIPVRIIVIEINDLNMARNDLIHALLAYHGFAFVQRVGRMNEVWENPRYDDLVAVAAAFARGERVLPLRPLHPGGQ